MLPSPDTKGNSGSTYLDALIAIIISSLAFAALVPLFALFIRDMPERHLEFRRLQSRVLFYQDLRQSVDQVEVPYWSALEDPLSATGMDGMPWNGADLAILNREKDIELTSNGLTRRYRFEEPPEVGLHRDQFGRVLGIQLTFAGEAPIILSYPQRILVWPDDTE